MISNLVRNTGVFRNLIKHPANNKHVIYRWGRSVLEKYFPSVSEASLNLWFWADSETSEKYFSVRTSQPVNNIYVFFFKLTTFDLKNNVVFMIMLVFLQAFETGRIVVYKNMFTSNSTGHCKKAQKPTGWILATRMLKVSFTKVWNIIPDISFLDEKIRNVSVLVKTGAFTLDM